MTQSADTLKHADRTLQDSDDKTRGNTVVRNVDTARHENMTRDTLTLNDEAVALADAINFPDCE